MTASNHFHMAPSVFRSNVRVALRRWSR